MAVSGGHCLRAGFGTRAGQGLLEGIIGYLQGCAQSWWNTRIPGYLGLCASCLGTEPQGQMGTRGSGSGRVSWAVSGSLTMSVPNSVSLLVLPRVGKSILATAKRQAGREALQWGLALLGCAQVPFWSRMEWASPHFLLSMPGHIQGMQPWWKSHSQGFCRSRSCRIAGVSNITLRYPQGFKRAPNPLKTPPKPRRKLSSSTVWNITAAFCIQLKIFFFFPLLSAQLLISAGSRSLGTCPRMSQRQRILGRPWRLTKWQQLMKGRTSAQPATPWAEPGTSSTCTWKVLSTLYYNSCFGRKRWEKGSEVGSLLIWLQQLHQFMPAFLDLGRFAQSSSSKTNKKYINNALLFPWTIKVLESSEQYKYVNRFNSLKMGGSQAEILMKCLVLSWMSDKKIQLFFLLLKTVSMAILGWIRGAFSSSPFLWFPPRVGS